MRPVVVSLGFYGELLAIFWPDDPAMAEEDAKVYDSLGKTSEAARSEDYMY